MRVRQVGRWFVVATGLVVLCACSPRYLHSELSPDASLYPVSRLAILPFVRGDRDGYPADRVDPGAEMVLTSLLSAMVEEARPYQLVPSDVVDREMARLADRPRTLEALAELSKRLAADAVLEGVVRVYRERRGSHVSVTQSASVGVELQMVSQRAQRTIWSGSYYETQQAMTEEVRTFPLYLERGARWLSVKELASYAFFRLIDTMPRMEEKPHAPAQ